IERHRHGAGELAAVEGVDEVDRGRIDQADALARAHAERAQPAADGERTLRERAVGIPARVLVAIEEAKARGARARREQGFGQRADHRLSAAEPPSICGASFRATVSIRSPTVAIDASSSGSRRTRKWFSTSTARVSRRS